MPRKPTTKTAQEKRLATLSKQTDSQQEALLRELEKYPIVQVACQSVGVGRSTYYAWRKDEAFARKADAVISAGVGFVNDMAESMLIKQIQEGHMTAIIFWLKNRHQAYATRTIHQIEIEQPAPLILNDEQRQAYINTGLGRVFKLNTDPEHIEKLNMAIKDAWHRGDYDTAKLLDSERLQTLGERVFATQMDKIIKSRGA